MGKNRSIVPDLPLTILNHVYVLGVRGTQSLGFVYVYEQVVTMQEGKPKI